MKRGSKEKSAYIHLCDDIQIAEGGHVRMCVGVHSDIMPGVKSLLELFRVLEDVNADHEVSCGNVIAVQKI